MKKVLLIIILLSCCTSALAQMIHEGDIYRDEDTDTYYYVILAGTGDFISMTDEGGSNRLSLNQVSKLSEDYTSNAANGTTHTNGDVTTSTHAWEDGQLKLIKE